MDNSDYGGIFIEADLSMRTHYNVVLLVALSFFALYAVLGGSFHRLCTVIDCGYRPRAVTARIQQHYFSYLLCCVLRAMCQS